MVDLVSVQSLAALEKDIEAALDRAQEEFVTIGLKLAEVNRRGLYRPPYSDFAAYVEHRWPFSRRRAYQLMGAAETATYLCTIGTHLLPASERQYRMMGALPLEDRVIVWKQALADSEGEQPAAAAVAALIAERMAKLSDQEQLEVTQEYERGLTNGPAKPAGNHRSPNVLALAVRSEPAAAVKWCRENRPELVQEFGEDWLQETFERAHRLGVAAKK